VYHILNELKCTLKEKYFNNSTGTNYVTCQTLAAVFSYLAKLMRTLVAIVLISLSTSERFALLRHL
jgi:hypothetical protein